MPLKKDEINKVLKIHSRLAAFPARTPQQPTVQLSWRCFFFYSPTFHVECWCCSICISPLFCDNQLTNQQIVQLINQSIIESLYISQLDISGSLDLGHHQYFIPILNAVGMENPGVVPHFLRTKGAALVNVIEPHAIGGQLDHCCQLLLQFSYRLVQADVQLRQRQTVSTFRC